MRRIVLPGHGTATTFSPSEDTTVTVMANGKLIPIRLTAGQITHIEFLGSMPLGAAA